MLSFGGATAASAAPSRTVGDRQPPVTIGGLVVVTIPTTVPELVLPPTTTPEPRPEEPAEQDQAIEPECPPVGAASVPDGCAPECLPVPGGPSGDCPQPCPPGGSTVPVPDPDCPPPCPAGDPECDRPECPTSDPQCDRPECPTGDPQCDRPECPAGDPECDRPECPTGDPQCDRPECPTGDPECDRGEPECPEGRDCRPDRGRLPLTGTGVGTLVLAGLVLVGGGTVVRLVGGRRTGSPTTGS